MMLSAGFLDRLVESPSDTVGCQSAGRGQVGQTQGSRLSSETARLIKKQESEEPPRLSVKALLHIWAEAPQLWHQPSSAWPQGNLVPSVPEPVGAKALLQSRDMAWAKES